MSGVIHTGDALTVLRTLPDASVQCCVTSPPYWGLRDYRVAGQLGIEKRPSEYVAKLVAVFGEVRRVLRPDGTLWLNLGDSYNNRTKVRTESRQPARNGFKDDNWHERAARGGCRMTVNDYGLKEKDLVGIPWRVAFALQDAGWWLRSDIIWSKPVGSDPTKDRPTRSHEYMFLMSKSKRYVYDEKAIREATANGNGEKNRRTVWAIAPGKHPGAHFAVFPPELPERCILAGSQPGDVVLDPFAGSGTTCAVANTLGRSFIGIELNPDYVALGERRVAASNV